MGIHSDKAAARVSSLRGLLPTRRPGPRPPHLVYLLGDLISATTMSHKYDILVMGASGFTGQLVAKYLATQAPLQNFTWAAGGRNREKIEQKMRQVHAEPSEIFVADSNDEEALRAAVKQVKVVISL